jgi:hypothetical protein
MMALSLTGRLRTKNCTFRDDRLTKKGEEMLFYSHLKARSSGGERYLDTVEVGGSKPPGPTIKNLVFYNVFNSIKAILCAIFEVSIPTFLYMFIRWNTKVFGSFLGVFEHLSAKSVSGQNLGNL